MLFEESLAAALNTWAPLAAGEIHPEDLPQPPIYPAVVYVCDGGTRGDTQDGPDGLCESDVDLDCWGETYEQAKRLAVQVRLGINSQQRRPQTPLVEGGPIVARIKIGADRDGRDPVGLKYCTTIPATFRHYEET